MLNPVVEFKSISKSFFNTDLKKDVFALKDFNLAVFENQIFGIIGLNGAGKTTAIKCLLGLCRPDKGELRVFQKKAEDFDLNRIGFAPEIAEISEYFNCSEFLEFAIQFSGQGIDRGKILQVLEMVGLKKVTQKKVKELSKGMKQRLSIAAALIHDPELVIFDEPMTGLDPRGRKLVREIILKQKKEGKTVLFSTHILEDIEKLCDSIIIIDNGRAIFSGKPDELLKNHTSLQSGFESLISGVAECKKRN